MKKQVKFSNVAKITEVKGTLSFLIKGASATANITVVGPTPTFSAQTYKVSGELLSISNAKLDATLQKYLTKRTFSENVSLKAGKNEISFKNENLSFKLSFVLGTDYSVSEFLAEVEVYHKSFLWIIKSAKVAVSFEMKESVVVEDGAVEPETPIPVPVPPQQQPPISSVGPFNPMLGVGCMTYSWFKAIQEKTLERELDAIVKACRENNIDLGKIVIPIETHGINASPSNPVKGDWKSYFKDHCEAIPELYSQITRRGMGMVWYFWNSNTPGKGFKNSYRFGDSGNLSFILSCAEIAMNGMKDKSRLLVSGCNEDDNSTEANVRSGLRNWFVSKIPKNQLISYNGLASWARYNDFHPSSVKSLPTPPSNGLFTSDNGPIIAELYGSTWDSKTPNVQNHKTVMDKYLGKIPVIFYGIHQKASFVSYLNEWSQILSHASKKIGGSAVVIDPVGQGPTTVNWTKFPKVEWTGVDRSDKKQWPDTSVDDALVNALVYIDYAGSDRKCEWVRVGSNSSSIWNAVNAKDKKYYRPELVKGAVITLSLHDINGKKKVVLGKLQIP